MGRFEKATKLKTFLRAALFGPSGSGKTFSALRIATGMASITGGKIALIDTERCSASLYADRFDFDTLDLVDRSVEGYCDALALAEQEEYGFVIIDSLSHGWKELTKRVEEIASAKYKGNYWAAWKDGTPLQTRFIDTLLNYPGHTIQTMRSKTEWVVDNSSGKSKVNRIGLTPEQGKDIDYEFTFLMEMTTDHFGNVIKDRTGFMQDKIFNKPDEALGIELIEWLRTGADDPLTTFATDKQIKEIKKLGKAHVGGIDKVLKHYDANTLDELTMAQANQVISKWKTEVTENA